jgi:hypothetical protein
MATNPLLDFIRKPELSVKLPSNGKWYDEGMIDYTPNGEVEVYPMLPKDELLIMNPDALLSGQANIQILKSCVPSVKQPEKLFYPDANVLFLAIQQASYGKTLTLESVCPHCQKKADSYNSDEEIAKAEANGEIMLHPQELEIDIPTILSTITYLESEYIIETENGLKIFMQPAELKEKMQYGLMRLNLEKIMKSYREYDLDTDKNNETTSKIRNEIASYYNEMNDISILIITSCIQKIQLPDGTFVSDKEFVKEFVANTKSTIIGKLNSIIKEINAIGLPDEVEYTCDCCGTTWKSKFYGFNNVDFFG